MHGPWAPKEGHRFNPHKLLVDPCAREVEGDVADDPLFQCGEQEMDTDSAAVAPKSVVLASDFDWEDDQHPRVPRAKR